MESFLISVERPAYRIARVACRNRDDALDLVQDAMCRFVDKYSGHPRQQWKPLFYRILHNRIRDFQRRRSVRDRWQAWFKGEKDAERGDEPNLEQAADPTAETPEQLAKVGETVAALQLALQELPFRQQQAFLLRSWEELTVAETAAVMGCSQGSVKTHLSRAISRLRTRLGDYWP